MKLQVGLTPRITITFVLFASTLLIVLGTLSYYSGRSSLQDGAVSELLSTAIGKEAQINSWVDARVFELERLATSPYLQSDVNIVVDGVTEANAVQAAHDRALRLLATYTASTRNQLLLAIAHPVSGKIVLSTNGAYEDTSVIGQPYFEKARDSTYTRSPHTDKMLGRPAMVIGTALRAADGELLGIMIAWLDPAPMNNILVERSGLRYSEDSYLVNTDREVVTRPRFVPTTTNLWEKLQTEAVKRCLEGNSGILFGTDYRDIPAIIVYRWLPRHKLALITKIDQAEAYAPAREFGLTVGLIALLILLITSAIAVSLARQITKPLLALQTGVTRFGSGDHSVRLPATRNDELGQLARDFNNMAEAIAENEAQLRANAAQLEQRVSERTYELQRQADLLELAHNAIIVRDISGAIRFWNQGATETYGWTKDEAVGQNSHELLQTEFSVPLAEVERALLTHGRWEGELSHVTRQGNRIAVSSRQALQRNEQGEPVAVLKINSDITQQKKAQEELNRFFLLSLDMLSITSFEGYFLRLNPAWHKALGYTEAELIERPFVDFVHPDDRDATNAARASLSEGNELVSFENRYQCKDGSYRWLSWQAVPAVEHGVIYAAAHDITDRKRAEEHLTQAKDAAEAATRAKSEFLANMSHEIRTPMNGVIGLTNLLLKTPLSARQNDYLRLIKSSADALLRLLNDILDFSKMEARKLQLDITEFDLRETVGNSLKPFSALANEKGVELTFGIAPEVPNFVQGDPGRLSQIIVNLVGNALKFTKQGEVVVRVVVDSEESVEGKNDSHTMLHFSVSDTGIGISQAQQEYIFDAFAQADSSTTRQFGGTGLGLAIVCQLVALMNGRIWVDSVPGEGTTFHVSVPLEAVPDLTTTPLPLRPVVLEGMRVLVVDDNHTNRIILEDLLASWGMAPISVDNAGSALEELRQAASLGNPIPLTLLDSQMPGFDGFQLAEAITSDGSLNGVSIMMLSSNDMSDEVARCKALNMAVYLTKPIMQSELFNAIITATGTASGRIVSGDSVTGVGSVAAKPLNVLVAEDHPINQTLITEILHERGHLVTIANNGLEVLQLLEQQSFDVILMDGQMPEMDGYQATAEIRRREQSTGQHIRIIAVTANAMQHDRQVCLDAGMDDYLPKPIDEARMLELLEAEQASEGAVSPPASLVAEEVKDVEKEVNKKVADTVNVAVFDGESALKRVRGKPALLKQMVTVFLNELPSASAEIHQAVEAGSCEIVLRSSHRLRGAATTLGADSLVELLQEIERLGKGNDIERIAEKLPELRQRFSALSAEMSRFIEV